MTELTTLHQRLTAAATPEDVFGPLAGSQANQFADAHDTFRQLAKVAHADRYIGAADKALAHECFVLLNRFWKDGRERIYTGVYGTATPVAKPAAIVLKSKTHTYTALRELAKGDVSTAYLAVDETGTQRVLKVGFNASVTDLLDTEAKTLRKINIEASARLSSLIARYYPLAIESFDIVTDKQRRRVNVLSYDEHYVPITRLPAVVDPRHFVWIAKRLLTALQFTHDRGFVHGAVSPAHLLINPSNHGLMLVGWGQSVTAGTPLKVTASSVKAYPPEVLRRLPVSSATDLFLAAATLRAIAWSHLPARFESLLNACEIPAPTKRIAHASTLYHRIEAAAEDLYGPPRFVPLTL